jgi:hypothetical protein
VLIPRLSHMARTALSHIDVRNTRAFVGGQETLACFLVRSLPKTVRTSSKQD